MLSPQDKNLIIMRYLKGKEDTLIESYVLDGPTELKDRLGLSDEQWNVLFENLVFEHDLLMKVVKRSPEFFVETYVKYGILHIREVLEVGDRKFDQIWEPVFDYIGVENKGVLYHLIENREEYYQALMSRGADYLRKILKISAEKYENLWLKVLDIMLSNFCVQKFGESEFERGLKTFVELAGSVRAHRPLVKNF